METEELNEFEKFDAPWHMRLMMRIAPKIFIWYTARRQKLNPNKIDYAFKLFEGAKRIDIQSLPSRTGRGFVIYIDNELSLHFYQKGDTFYFDGFEMGEYENGDVQVFDNLE